MINRPSIAIAIIDTDQYQLALSALNHSLNGFEFNQVLIFSDDEKMWGGRQIVQIEKIESINQYNWIVTQLLPNKLTCDFVLIVQFDGFILNPNVFDHEFYKYDYIGAPWPNFDEFNVGNGGFSLRSRRLVEKVSQYPYDDLAIAEDIFICRYLQAHPDFKEFKFAPKHVAEKFSVEFPAVPFPTFGFHGIFHLPNIYANNLDYLIKNLSSNTILRRYDFLFPFIYLISPHASENLTARYNLANNKRNLENKTNILP